MFKSTFADSTFGKSGMVAAAHPLATIAGYNALRSGGNAMDACLTMVSVTSAVLPHMCGLGGDAFLIYYDATKGGVHAINGSGVSGDGSTLERFVGEVEILPQDGIMSVAVPGAPLVYELAAKRFGTFSLSKCFKAGAKIAEEGFVVTPRFERDVQNAQNKLSRYTESSKIFLSNGKAPKAGTVLKQTELAHTLREFGHQGAEYFYKGAFAEKFYEINRKAKGTFHGDEFSRHFEESTSWYKPISTDYRGFEILETAPVSPGFLVLEQMNIIENFDFPQINPLSYEAIHLMVEAKKVAFSDRNAFAGDPQFTDFDVSKLISKDYAREMANRITRFRSSPIGTDTTINGDTTSFVAWDKQGNCCSFIHSIAFSFGSGVMVPGTGVLLNNRAGRSFNLISGHPNCLMPGKRPMHTLNCYMVFKDDKPFIVGGTLGGDGQPQWNMQILSLILDHQLGPQQAVEFPRWRSYPGTDMIGVGGAPKLMLESRFPQDTIDSLAQMGHSVETVGPFSGGGGAQIIMKHMETGALLAGSDTRVDGVALGF